MAGRRRPEHGARRSCAASCGTRRSSRRDQPGGRRTGSDARLLDPTTRIARGRVPTDDRGHRYPGLPNGVEVIMTVAATRSELTRLRRRSFTLGWLGLTAVLAFMITTFSFVVAGDGTDVSVAPGGGFPPAAELAGSDGRMLALGAASTILGVVSLSCWAVAAASDYSTG